MCLLCSVCVCATGMADRKKQVTQRRSHAYSSEEDEFRAFAFTNSTSDDEMVCPLDNMEWELKIRNQV